MRLLPRDPQLIMIAIHNILYNDPSLLEVKALCILQEFTRLSLKLGISSIDFISLLD